MWWAMDSDESALLKNRLTSTATWLNARPAYLWLLALILASLLRSGFVIWNWFELSPLLITDWSSPGNAFQSNVLFNAFGTLWAESIGEPTDSLWLISQIVLTVAGLTWITYLVYRHTSADVGYLGAALVLSTGISAVLWREIGRYDVFFLVAVTIAVLTASRRIWIPALMVAAVSAPEQSILASLSLLALTLIPRFQAWRQKAIWFIGLAVTAAVAVQIWFTLAGDAFTTRIGVSFQFLRGEEITVPSRFDVTQSPIQLIVEKFYQGFSNGPGLIWSYLGALSLVLILVIFVLPKKWHMLFLISSVIIFPLFTTIFFGEDPTRDLTIVAAPMLIVLVVAGSKIFAQLLEKTPAWSVVWLVWGAVAITILPTLYFFVQPEAPFDFAIHMLTSWNNGTPIDWSGNTR
jgi:hypothetical protein